MSRPDPSALRWLIGAELRNARNRAGLSITQVADRSKIGRPKLGHMETGKYTQYPADIAKFLEVCNAKQSDIDRLSSLAGKTDEKSWWAPYATVLPDWNRTYVGLEGMASHMFTYEPVVLPGLLQTAEYAEMLTETVGFVRPDHAERFVEFRRARAERLTSDEQPLHLHAVIEEGALRRVIGDPDVMGRQYEHLLEIAELDTVVIQVARPADGPHSALGQFTILDFDIAQSIAFIEQIDGAVYAQDRDAVNAYKMVSENLERVALNPAKSRNLITHADTWK
ncbi:helix-turn-helix protein [Stackebrandtia endophytica]|uniref:Helix-turn-helix protein n=1 Tax=Stackebrandtia endophytica TaxID=1496996 RepID=A0A543AVC5_9ACTN|nr:helix-turn-helix transcriptional regulator [Stackebrandtia endophytica]TQL76501.1 helix-turn-helix protein [Stackebrandtia endophytica]